MIVERLGRDRAGFGLTVDVNGEAQLRRRVSWRPPISSKPLSDGAWTDFSGPGRITRKTSRFI